MKRKNIIYKSIAVFMAGLLLTSCGTDKNGKQINSKLNVPSVNDMKLWSGIRDGNFEVIDEAIQDGTDINHLRLPINISTFTNSIDIAINEKNTDSERYMILKGADVNHAKILTGSTVLMGEAYNNNIEFCDLLLKHGAKIGMTDREGSSALEYAVKGEQNEKARIHTVEFLLKNGAEVTQKTIDVAMANKEKQYASDNGLDRLLLKEFISKGGSPNMDPVLEAAILGNSSKLAELIDAGKMQQKYENQILFFTAAFGDVASMKLLESKGLNVHTADYRKNTLLITASQYGNLEMTKYLISKGLDPRAVNTQGYNAVTLAADNDCSEIVKYYLQNVSGINYDDFKSNKLSTESDALNLAAGNGNIELIDFMLKKGFVLDEKSLFSAIEASVYTIRMSKYLPDVDRQLKVVQHLLDEGKKRNVSCDLSFFLADSTNLKTVQFMVERGANVNGVTGRRSPLSAAINSIDTIKYLIQKGANVTAPTIPVKSETADETLLQEAVKKGRMDVIKLLVEHGTNLKYEGADKSTALNDAAKSGSRNVLEYLLQKGAKVNHQNSKGETALIYAIQSGWVQSVNLLLKYGADKNIKDSDGKTAFDIAKSNKDNIMMELLK